MFVSDKIVFLELHKTGGSHIGTWLNKLIDGEQVGKHNRLPQSLSHRYVIGSIRNPWDWYVSLWAYGCKGLGSVYLQVNRPFSLRYCLNQLGPEMGCRVMPAQILRQFLGENNKPVHGWRACYQDVNDPLQFRAWLKLILSKERRFDVGEGFGFSPVSSSFGLLSYRYLKFFTSLDRGLYSDSRLASLDGISEIVAQNSLVDYVIRNENLESDLLDGLKKAGVDIDDMSRSSLLAGAGNKINASVHKGRAHYYDQECIDLVAKRECFIVEKYGYNPVDLTTP